MASAGRTRHALDLLLSARVLSTEVHASVLAQVKQRQLRSEEVLIVAGVLDEATLLRTLSGLYRTQFVSSEKLSRFDIPRATWALVPKVLAQRELLFPVAFDAATLTVSVVTPDPDDDRVLEEAKLASGARHVKAFLARPSAVLALVSKYHDDNRNAFLALQREAATSSLGPRQQVFSADGRLRAATGKPAAADDTPKPEAVSASKLAVAEEASSWSAESLGATSEMVGVLVNLLESSRGELRGHSAGTAHLCRSLAARLGLPAAEIAEIALGALMHDLGKMSGHHLTALNVAQYAGHQKLAEKLYDAPVRLFESVALPKTTHATVTQMYERFGELGIPGRVRGQDIALGARILAVADSYADLTQNSKNPYGRVLSPKEACSALGSFKSRVLDPDMVDLFRTIVTGGDIRARLLENGRRVLIVDGSPEDTTVLELRLLEQGFDVQIARNCADARRQLAKGDYELVVSELSLDDGSGIELLEGVRASGGGRELPWVVLTSHRSQQEAQRCFELGVLDYATKPVHAEVFVAKLRALLAQSTAASKSVRGVQGSLREMSLLELVQVLSQGRRSGRLGIEHAGSSGAVFFREGQVVEASFQDARGDRAFYRLMRLQDGEFVLDPSVAPPQGSITEPTESLLLEAMRRMDESVAD